MLTYQNILDTTGQMAITSRMATAGQIVVTDQPIATGQIKA
jgi:hypothetical protein